MVSQDQAELQSWYRSAMADRVEELRSMRSGVRAGDSAVLLQTRELAQQLRGSGGTFGFPEVSEAAGVVEQSDDAGLMRRLEGMIGVLNAVAAGGEEGQWFSAEWLTLAAGLGSESSALDDVAEMADAWSRVAAEAGVTTGALADRVASYLGLEVADFDRRSASADRLVPSALVLSARIIPVAEDVATITVATANPTSLPMELELRRLTGRTPVFQVASPAAIDALLEEQTGAPPPAPARPPRSAAVDPEPDAERHVLVVDDQAGFRTLVRSLLEKREYSVSEAEDGLDALGVLDGGVQPDLVVIDLNMPRMDGLELIWELRADDRWSGLPLIVVTAETDEILETQLMEEGADDYITKPIDPRLFLARIDATIRRNESRRRSSETR